MVALIGVGDRDMMMAEDDTEAWMDFELKKVNPCPDRGYGKSSTSELVDLYCSRLKRFATLLDLKAPEPIIGFEHRLLAQAKRLLSKRGIRT